MSTLIYPHDVSARTYGSGETIITVTWMHYSAHYRFYIPPTQGEINEVAVIGRLRLNEIRQQIKAVTKRLS